jgi:hypothetical protein
MIWKWLSTRVAGERRCGIRKRRLVPVNSITPPEAVWPGGCQHAAVLRTIEDEWRFCGRARVEELAQWAKNDPRIAHLIAHADPNKFILVEEYSSCAYGGVSQSDEFAGKPMRSWIRDEAGLHVGIAEELETLEAERKAKNGRGLGYTLVAFYCYPNGTDVLWSVVASPRVGRGGRCAVDPRNPELSGMTWVC